MVPMPVHEPTALLTSRPFNRTPRGRRTQAQSARQRAREKMKNIQELAELHRPETTQGGGLFRRTGHLRHSNNELHSKESTLKLR